MSMLDEHRNKSKDDLELIPFNKRYEGYIMELLKHLQRQLDFKIEWHVVDATGTINPDGHWTGAIKKLVDRVGTRASSSFDNAALLFGLYLGPGPRRDQSVCDREEKKSSRFHPPIYVHR